MIYTIYLDVQAINKIDFILRSTEQQIDLALQRRNLLLHFRLQILEFLLQILPVSLVLRDFALDHDLLDLSDHCFVHQLDLEERGMSSFHFFSRFGKVGYCVQDRTRFVEP